MTPNVACGCTADTELAMSSGCAVCGHRDHGGDGCKARVAGIYRDTSLTEDEQNERELAVYAARREAARSQTATERLREALSKLPPGPYRVDGPDEQGGSVRIWGRQGTPPDFTDGWAFPLVAVGAHGPIE